MARPTFSSSRRPLAALAAAATGLSGIALLAPVTSNAASHREAPFIAEFDPEVDNTDVYAFVSPDDPDTVSLIGNFWPFEEPDGGPNFYRFDDGARYDINIDNDGDAVPDIIYRWTFDNGFQNEDTFLYNTGVVESLDDPDLNFRETYDLEVIRDGQSTMLLDDAPVAPSNVGPASMPDYEALRDEAIIGLSAGQENGGQSFAGQADDSFFLDLRIFDLLYGADFSEIGNDTLNGYNVQTLALQVPKAALALNAATDRNPVIGVWSTTSVQQTKVLNDDGTSVSAGDYVQVSRLGNPLVNEVVIPIKDKDRFNGSTPANDAQFLEYVTDPLVPPLVEAIYDIPAPPTPRNDLVEVFLTGICNEAPCPDTIGEVELNSLLLNQDVSTIAPAEMLRLNMSIPPTATPDRLGVIGGDLAGFPNGRRLVDDVVDIELQVLEGELLDNPNDLGDAVSSNDLPFMATFPYVALPHQGAVNASKFTTFERLAGADRFGTAAEIAVQTFGTSDTVLLANGLERHLADSLAGNYLAGIEDAPILLTTNDTTPAVTLKALQDLGAQRVIILGGTDAISAAQAAQLDAAYDVTRIGGADRYATAALIATTPALAANGETAFRVEVTNVSKATGTTVETPQGPKPIFLSPGAWATYSGNVNPAFTVGAKATEPLGGEGLENLAEDGFPMRLAEQLAGAPTVSDSGTFVDPQGPKPALEPGMSTSFTVTASAGEKLTLATMFVPSNDAFYGPSNGIELFDSAGDPVTADVTSALGTFDAGTEENQPFFGPATKPSQPSPDFGPVEDSVVLPVADVDAQPQVYPEVDQVIRVTIAPATAGAPAPASDTAIVARGDVYPDALVSGPISYRAQFPVLLTPPGGLAPATQRAIEELGIEEIIIAGGPMAVSDVVAEQLRDSRGNDSVATTRVAGDTRQGTAVAMAKFATDVLGFSRLHVNLARGDIAIDALTGGPHAGREGGVILLTVGNDQLGTVTRDYLVAESITLEDGHVFGGPAAVSVAVVAEAQDAANSNDEGFVSD